LFHFINNIIFKIFFKKIVYNRLRTHFNPLIFLQTVNLVLERNHQQIKLFIN